MKKWLLLLVYFIPSLSSANSCVSSAGTGTKVWESAGSWSSCGGAYPSIGDTASVSDGVNAVIQNNETVGVSGSTGTVAISLNNSGSLEINGGVTLKVRGDIVYTGNSCGNHTTAVTMDAGSTLTFDSSISSSSYAFGQGDGTSGCRAFVSNGTGSAWNTVNTLGPAYGRFDPRGGSGATGSMTATYTSFVNLGNASNTGFLTSFEFSGSDYITWNVQHSSFTHCGAIMNGNAIGVDLTGTEVHNYNYHSDTQGGSIIDFWLNIDTHTPTGTRQIIGNVFDRVVDGIYGAWDLAGFTIDNNYFNDFAVFGTAYSAWASFKGNFYRDTDATYGGIIDLGTTADYNVIFLDDPYPFNPHGPDLQRGAGPTAGITNNIMDVGGSVDRSVSSFFIPNINQVNGSTLTISNNLILPGVSGQTTFWIGVAILVSSTATPAFPHYIQDHNTDMTGWNITGGVSPGLGFVSYHPTTITTPEGMVLSFRSNLMWNSDPSNKTYKVYAFGGASPPTLNPFLPANGDYNGGFNMLHDGGSVKNGSDYTNGGNGYADNFSSTPGVHDVNDQDPQFVDNTRNVATFDSGYLHHSYPSWNSGTTYAVGDLITNSTSTVYAGAAINYRYVNGTWKSTPCSGANPTPGISGSSGALSHACWEWATLNQLRIATVNDTRFNDYAMGVNNDTLITTLHHWIMAGYVPKNSAYAQAAHDGGTIGVQSFYFSAPTSDAPPPPTSNPANLIINGPVKLKGRLNVI